MAIPAPYGSRRAGCSVESHVRGRCAGARGPARRAGPRRGRSRRRPRRAGVARGRSRKRARRLHRDVLAEAAIHGATLSRGSSYFWTTPAVHAAGHLEIDLPWHDADAEARRFIASLLNDAPGELYADQDPGWQLDVFRSGEFVYARRRDPDDDVTLVHARFAWRPFVRSARAALDRGDALIAALRQAIGEDHWS